MTPSPATFDDGTLIKLALAGQTECFSALMDRHLAAVRGRIASIVWNPSDAEDLVQDVLLKVWRHLSTYRSESSFRTWMTRVAINEVVQWYRREQRRPVCQAFGDLDTFASSVESPHLSLARVEATRTVRRAAGPTSRWRMES